MRSRLPALLLATVTLAGAAGCGEGDRPDRPAAAAPAATSDAAGRGVVFPTVAPADVAADVRAGRTLLVDVREAGEWDAGRAPKAMHVPLADVERRLGEIRARADGRPVAFICRTGRRSAQAATIASAGGLPEVLNVDGGMSAWASAGLPLVPRDGRVA